MVFQALAGASLLPFCANGETKTVTGHWKLINTVFYVGFGSSVQRTVIGEQKLVDDNSLHLCLYLKPSEVEDRAVNAVSNVDSIIQATKCIEQHHRKHDTEKSGVQDASLLNLIFDVKGYGTFSFAPLHVYRHEIVWRRWWIFRGGRILPWFSKAVSADHVKYLGQINISRVDVSVLFLTLLLQLSCSKHYVNSPTFLSGSRIDFPVRLHVRDAY